MESYYEAKSNYSYWKKQCSDDMVLGLNEETDIGKFDTMMYNEHQSTLLSEISEVKYQILDDVNDSFSKTIAVIDTIIALNQSDDDKLYFLTNTDRSINVLLKCLNEIFRSLSINQGIIESGLTYYQSKNYSDNLIKQLIDKLGWESIVEDLSNLQSSEMLCVDYQLEEYKLIVYDDKSEAFNDIKTNIESIEANTDLFIDYNDEICEVIDNYWSMIDFDYNNYYSEM